MPRSAITSEPRHAVEFKTVRLTDERVRRDQVCGVKLPKGARLATDEECSSAFYHIPYAGFRDHLYINRHAWTGKVISGSGHVAVRLNYILNGSLYADVNLDPELRAPVAYVFDDKAQAGREIVAQNEFASLLRI